MVVRPRATLGGHIESSGTKCPGMRQHRSGRHHRPCTSTYCQPTTLIVGLSEVAMAISRACLNMKRESSCRCAQQKSIATTACFIFSGHRQTSGLARRPALGGRQSTRRSERRLPKPMQHALFTSTACLVVKRRAGHRDDIIAVDGDADKASSHRQHKPKAVKAVSRWKQ